MITWMQRHKKWLVITIWLSTIAFVGAGFVGWGSYNYGSSAGSLATVGDLKVQQKDLQNEYNILYQQYEQKFGNAFNKELAKQLKLDQIAFQTVIQKFLLLNYGHSLGLYITNEEVAKYLVTIPAFLQNGKFSKDTYLKVLKQNRTTPADFEDQIKKDLLIKKVQIILDTKVGKTELDNLNKLFFSQDRVSINIINNSNFKVDSSKSNVKKYWEDNKQKYTTLESYNIKYYKVKITDDVKKSKRASLETYLKLKKGQLDFSNTALIDVNTKLFTAENFIKIKDAKIKKVLKPIENGKYFYIVQVTEKKQPEPLSFDKAYNKAKQDYIAVKTAQLIDQKIATISKNFSGKDVGFLNFENEQKIDGLTDDEVMALKRSVSSSTTQINSVKLNNKAVVYKITDSKIGKASLNIDIKGFVQNIKSNETINKLIEKLQNQYSVVSNVKVK